MTKVARGPVIKSASLDVILAANSLKTTDEMRLDMYIERDAKSKEFYDSTGVYLNSSQRKNLRKVMAKAGKDILGNPLV